MAEATKVYWDSCVWIGLINEEADKVDSAKWVWERARNGEIEIWTSVLTLAEVFKAKCADGKKGIDEERDKLFEELLKEPFIFLVQVDSDVAGNARRLLRADLPGLKKPNDAIHLASAQWHNLDEVHTFDREDLLVLDGLIKRDDGRDLRICKPPKRPPPAQPGLFDGAAHEGKQTDDDQASKAAEAHQEPAADAGAAVRGNGAEAGVRSERGELRSEAGADSEGEAADEQQAEEAVTPEQPPPAS